MKEKYQYKLKSESQKAKDEAEAVKAQKEAKEREYSYNELKKRLENRFKVEDKKHESAEKCIEMFHNKQDLSEKEQNCLDAALDFMIDYMKNGEN